jgi:predicted ATP-binding protein involved in virulence
MIGPNGSGKSNLLDIIHAVWKYGITINYSINNNDNKIPTITNTNNTQHNLTKHRGQENQKSHIYLSILLSQDDYNNILFLIKNQQIINTIIKKYSDISFQFSSINKEDFLNHSNKIPLYLNITKDNHIVLESNDDSVVSFIYQYFQNFELIQLCMEIYNTYEKKENSERYPLRNTFALITSETTISQTYTNKAIHLFCKKINSIQQQHGEKSIFEQFFIESLNNTLEQYT